MPSAGVEKLCETERGLALAAIRHEAVAKPRTIMAHVGGSGALLAAATVPGSLLTNLKTNV